MGKYASKTSVAADRSRAEIEKILHRYGAEAFMYATNPKGAMIGFKASGRSIRMMVPMPNVADYYTTPDGRTRTDKAAASFHEQDIRQRWRALGLVVKAKLEAVESGVATFEQEFLPYTLMPNGKTAAEWLLPQIATAYETKKMPPLLLGE